jgi:hypothetical protein
MSEWSTPATIISILSMLGVGYLAPKAWTALAKSITGRAQKARTEVDRLRADLTKTNLALDLETAHRRRLQEALSQTRVVATEHGVPYDKPPTRRRSSHDPRKPSQAASPALSRPVRPHSPRHSLTVRSTAATAG